MYCPNHWRRRDILPLKSPRAHVSVSDITTEDRVDMALAYQSIDLQCWERGWTLEVLRQNKSGDGHSLALQRASSASHLVVVYISCALISPLCPILHLCWYCKSLMFSGRTSTLALLTAPVGVVRTQSLLTHQANLAPAFRARRLADEAWADEARIL